MESKGLILIATAVFTVVMICGRTSRNARKKPVANIYRQAHVTICNELQTFPLSYRAISGSKYQSL